MSDIILQSLSKSYGDRRVLRDYSACLPEGKLTVLMGPSGCGKTTLLRILAGLEQPDGGAVTGLGPSSVAFQEDRLVENISAAANIAMVTGKSRADCTAALAQMGLDGLAARTRAGSLSGGQARRVSLLRALLFEAPLVLLDEPFRGLDAQSRLAAAEVIRRMGEGRTLLVVTHEEADAALLDAAQVLRLEPLREG